MVDVATWEESLRLARATERLGAIILGAVVMNQQVASVAEATGADLAAELGEIQARIEEILAHVEAAGIVVATKLEILQERWEEQRES